MLTTITLASFAIAGFAAAGCGGSGGKSNADAGIHDPPLGQPITATDLTWTWVDFPDAQCRDGTPTGLMVNFNSASDKLVIFLEGGGACFNPLTCAGNPSHADATDTFPPTGGIFNRTDTANPVADWNYVYIPFCTGDVFGGNKPNGTVDGVMDSSGTALAKQQFVGWTNIGLFLSRIVPTFPNATQVLLTGRSAGGFGAALNAVRTARVFGSIPVVMLDDSGPPMSDTYVPSCLQQQWNQLWGFDQGVLADCGSDCPDHNNFTMDLVKHSVHAYPTAPAGLISAQADGVITFFFGFGANNCSGTAVPLTGAQYQAGLEEFRTNVTALTPHYGTFYINSTTHTWIGDDTLYATVVNGVAMKTWVGNLLNGQISQVSP
jgi:hypothetical protein